MIKLNKNKTLKLAIIGLGYVGLPLACAFSKKMKVISFDVDMGRIQNLKKGIDNNREISKFRLTKNKNLVLTFDEEKLKDCNFFIITVPTPIFKNKKPDLNYLISATKLVAKYITKGSFVVYESTVYPGCTEEICLPIIEKISGYKVNNEFFCGYSPERINPGDKKNKLENIKKVISGSNNYSTTLIDKLYKSIIKAGTYRAQNIKTAEAAKVIENTQRDINIALMNEFSIICNKLKINTKDAINAACSKWNFLRFRPGLVGGHCIGVDPYYLSFKAKQTNYDPKIILSGRELNDKMPVIIVKNLIRILKKRDFKNFSKIKILIIGLTFKENCSDIRNSKTIELIKLLQKKNFKVFSYDPVAFISDNNLKKIFGYQKNLKKNYYDVILLSIPHKTIINKGSKFIKKAGKKNFVFFDLKSAIPNIKSMYNL